MAAETLLVGWTKARPSDATAWHNLGRISLNNGELDRAISCFKKIHALDPKDNFAIAPLAKLYFQKKNAQNVLTTAISF